MKTVATNVKLWTKWQLVNSGQVMVNFDIPDRLKVETSIKQSLSVGVEN